MKKNTKSSITLPPEELAIVNHLAKKLGAKSKVEVIRRGLRLLKNQSDRSELREAYAKASASIKATAQTELDSLDGVSDDGIN